MVCEILLFELMLKSFLQDGWNTLVWIQNELWVAVPSLNADRGDSFWIMGPQSAFLVYEQIIIILSFENCVPLIESYDMDNVFEELMSVHDIRFKC